MGLVDWIICPYSKRLSVVLFTPIHPSLLYCAVIFNVTLHCFILPYSPFLSYIPVLLNLGTIMGVALAMKWEVRWCASLSSFKSSCMVCCSLFFFCHKDCSIPDKGWSTRLNPEMWTTQNRIRASWHWTCSVSKKQTFLVVSDGDFGGCYHNITRFVLTDIGPHTRLIFFSRLTERGIPPSAPA